MSKYSKKTWKATAMLSVNNQSSMKIPYSFQLSQQDYSWTKQSACIILNLIQTFAPPSPPPTNKHAHTQTTNHHQPTQQLTTIPSPFSTTKDSCHCSFFYVIHLSCPPPPPLHLLIWLWLPVAASLFCHSADLKETPERDASWPKTSKMCKYFHWQALYSCSINIYATNTFLFQIWAPQGAAMSTGRFRRGC